VKSSEEVLESKVNTKRMSNVFGNIKHANEWWRRKDQEEQT